MIPNAQREERKVEERKELRIRRKRYQKRTTKRSEQKND